MSVLRQKIIKLVTLAGNQGISASEIGELISAPSHKLEPELTKLVNMEEIAFSWRDSRKVTKLYHAAVHR